MPQRRHREVTEELRSEIGSYLSSNCVGFPDNRLGEFLGLSVGRILLKESRLGGDWRSVATDDQLRHIADWLKSSLINDAAWLSNVDAHGRPKKLMKFGSIDQITQEADKAMLKASQRLSGVKLVEGDEELYAELDDGYHLVRLLTPAALDRESSQMQHCIGDGAYDEQVKSKYYLYLSLRDAAGNPHATLEFQDNALVQLQGKQNAPPVSKYLDRLIPFIKEQSFAVLLPVREFQHVVDDSGRWHPIEGLPDGLTVSGCLCFIGTDIRSLPDGMTVGGNLILQGTGIIDLPKGLSVGEDLWLYNTGITSLPDDLTVGGSLLLRWSKITSLPEGLSVGDSLDLYDTPISSLPRGLTVGGFLDLRDTQVTSLPKGLSVGFDIHLTDTKIRSLPEDIHVGGNLILTGSEVTSLPEGLSVGESLYLRGSKIEKLPDVLSVGADLDVRGTSISEIPEGVTVGGKILSDNLLLDLRPNIACS